MCYVGLAYTQKGAWAQSLLHHRPSMSSVIVGVWEDCRHSIQELWVPCLSYCGYCTISKSKNTKSKTYMHRLWGGCDYLPDHVLTAKTISEERQAQVPRAMLGFREKMYSMQDIIYSELLFAKLRLPSLWPSHYTVKLLKKLEEATRQKMVWASVAAEPDTQLNCVRSAFFLFNPLKYSASTL